MRIFFQKRIFLGTLYLPPSFKLDLLAKLDESIDLVFNAMNDNDNLIIVGDINCRDINWVYDANDILTVDNANELSSISSRFIEILDSHNLSQFNKNPTCNDAVLDYVITDGMQATCSLTANATSSTHKAIDVSIDVACTTSPTPTPRKVYSYKKADFNAIIQALSCIWWCGSTCLSTVDEAFDEFYDVLHAVIRDNVPQVNIKVHKYPSWYNHELITLIKQKFKWRKKFVKGGRDVLSFAYKQFSKLRAEVKQMQKHLYTEYISSVCHDIKENPKRFWSFTKSKRSSSSIPSKITYNSNTYSTVRLIATAFNNYFKSVFINDEPLKDCHFIPFKNAPVFRIPPLTYEEVRDKLKSLNHNGASGADNISAIFLSKSADALCIPLTDLFNRSLKEGLYPSALKFNNVIPIFKKGKKVK